MLVSYFMLEKTGRNMKVRLLTVVFACAILAANIFGQSTKPASSTLRKELAGIPESQPPKTESGIPLPEAHGGGVTKPLSNSDVIQMVKAGLKESLILKAMEANGAEFDITAPTLIELSKS